MYSINKNEVLRYLGYRGQEIPHDIDALIDRLIEKALKTLSPSYTHMISDIEKTGSGLYLKGTSITLTGNDIKKHLDGAEKCIILACTLGMKYESEMLKLQAKSVTEAVIFDSVGTALIEEVADRAEEKLLFPLKCEGYFSKFRYSPGYGDLPLDIQKDIINSLQCQKKIGLTLTDTNLLIPQKSVTAFIGIFNTPQEKPKSKCELCSARDTCKMRKEGKTCD